MKKALALGMLVAPLMFALPSPAAAGASTDAALALGAFAVFNQIVHGQTVFSGVFGAPVPVSQPPVVYAPPPVYTPPPAVVYTPPPVVYTPPPAVVYAPPPVVVVPAPAVVYAPAPVVVRPGGYWVYRGGHRVWVAHHVRHW